jgi:hypothetical protein
MTFLANAALGYNMQRIARFFKRPQRIAAGIFSPRGSGF